VIEVLDSVVLTGDRPDHGLLAGQLGTVTEKFSDTDYLVEFSSEDGEVFELVFANAAELLKLLPTPAVARSKAAA
jgi:hypothetical protein